MCMYIDILGEKFIPKNAHHACFARQSLGAGVVLVLAGEDLAPLLACKDLFHIGPGPQLSGLAPGVPGTKPYI